MNKEHELTPVRRKDGSESLPARGYSWSPFLPDHVKNMVHGGNSPKVIEAVARIVRSEVTEQAPWLLEPIFADSLERYARSEAKARLLADHILRVCEDQGAARVPVRLWESSVACDNAASRAANDLGLTPLSRARLAALTTSTEVSARNLDDLSATGAAIRAKRQEAIEAESVDDD